MTYTPGHIANFMLERADREGRALTQLKLLKLVYIAYGWVLATLDKKLFDEPIYAWQHGPVIRSLYDEFKHYGRDPIDCRSVSFDLETFDMTEPRIDDNDTRTLTVLDKVWDVYKGHSAWALRNKTHEPDTPWSRTYQEGVRDTEISDDLIKPHFEAKIRQILDNVAA